jgi:hypothetical protein
VTCCLGWQKPVLTVTVVQADMADEEAVRGVLNQSALLGPLAGVVHAAGVLDDGLAARPRTPSASLR